MATLSKKDMALAAAIAKAVVTALKEESAIPQTPAEGRKSAKKTASSDSQKKAPSKKSATSEKKATKLTIADFEPKGSKCEQGYMNWSSYKSQRTKYCYFVATKGEVKDGSVFGTKWYGKVDFAEGSAFAKAKAEYTARYHYIKKEDRE